MEANETVSRPVYETPKIIEMDRDEVLQAFQMTAAQISAAGCWWSSTCHLSPCVGGVNPL